MAGAVITGHVDKVTVLCALLPIKCSLKPLAPCVPITIKSIPFLFTAVAISLAGLPLEHSKKVKADLISVLTDHESELTGMFLGTFAKQIVNHSKTPILSMRPAKLGVSPTISFAGFNS